MTRAELIEIIEGELPTAHFSNGEGGNVCCDYVVLADFIIEHTEELREEVKKGMKQAVINEELRNDFKTAHVVAETLKQQNAELKALVDEVEKTLERHKFCSSPLMMAKCVEDALAKIAEFKKGGK